MSFFLTQDQVEALPDDPRQRFVSIERICREKYEASISEEEVNWGYVKDCRLRYMSSVLAAAKYLRIEPICDLELPLKKNFSDDDYDDFISQIEFFSIQLILEGAENNSRLSISLEGSTRDRLITLVAHLKDHVGRLDLPPARRDTLIKRIDDFEAELRRPKLTFLAVAAMALFVAGAIADVGGSADVVRKLISQIEASVGLAKEEQDKVAASKISPAISEKKLLPPRSDQISIKQRKNYELDEDIPF